LRKKLLDHVLLAAIDRNLLRLGDVRSEVNGAACDRFDFSNVNVTVGANLIEAAFVRELLKLFGSHSLFYIIVSAMEAYESLHTDLEIEHVRLQLKILIYVPLAHYNIHHLNFPL
jgi:hypothetical protein